jgi:hypothetical protein
VHATNTSAVALAVIPSLFDAGIKAYPAEPVQQLWYVHRVHLQPLTTHWRQQAAHHSVQCTCADSQAQQQLSFLLQACSLTPVCGQQAQGTYWLARQYAPHLTVINVQMTHGGCSGASDLQ